MDQNGVLIKQSKEIGCFTGRIGYFIIFINLIEITNHELLQSFMWCTQDSSVALQLGFWAGHTLA